MNFASPENIKIIKLLRSNIIPPESIQNMRLHVKSLIVEAKQDNSSHDNVDGAIKVVALIDCCIRELSKFDINYFQGPKDGRAFIHDLITEKSAFVDIKYEKKTTKRKKHASIIDENNNENNYNNNYDNDNNNNYDNDNNNNYYNDNYNSNDNSNDNYNNEDFMETFESTTNNNSKDDKIIPKNIIVSVNVNESSRDIKDIEDIEDIRNSAEFIYPFSSKINYNNNNDFLLDNLTDYYELSSDFEKYIVQRDDLFVNPFQDIINDDDVDNNDNNKDNINDKGNITG
ncbi:hypothetical protein Glove_74g31 [Diversispora epigaea]|uniref:VHS domain-containing protein n=1 Tax=Diversispora epigaea TaxID=1348612 RepID=A0A397JA84_9GLOM|nr:hypothetical protein Glove_74g31 [Diversispora epigaea]